MISPRARASVAHAEHRANRGHAEPVSIAGMRRSLPHAAGPVALTVLLACTGTPRSSDAPSPAGSGPVAPASTASTASAVPPSAPTPTASALPTLPAGVPSTYPRDVPAGDVPLRALIPRGTAPEGSWYARTPTGDAIVVAYARRGPDPFRAQRGFVVWRRSAGVAPFWRAIAGVGHAADEGVASTRILIADVTGDGVPDALVNEITGGSGACGTWRVVELEGGAELWNRGLCDAQVVPAADPAGIEITRAVFGPGDAHCCPGATRTTVLTYAGDGRWVVAATKLTPTGA